MENNTEKELTLLPLVKRSMGNGRMANGPDGLAEGSMTEIER